MKDPFADLVQFYNALDELLPPPGHGNSCGDCWECCSYNFFLSSHEFTCLKFFLQSCGHESLVDFRVARHPRDLPATPPGYRCPLYQDKKGCRAYPARPYACRVMGPWWPVTTPLYPRCIFPAPRVYSSVENLPLWHHYEQVLRRHPSFPGVLIPRGSLPGGSPLDQGS